MLRNCSILLTSSCFEWGLWENNGSAIAYPFFIISKPVRKQAPLIIRAPSFLTFFLNWATAWSTHFTWNSCAAVYSSLCTFVIGQTCRGLCALDKHAGSLRVLLFWPIRSEEYNQTDLCQPITGLEKCQGERDRERLLTSGKPLYFVDRFKNSFICCLQTP